MNYNKLNFVYSASFVKPIVIIDISIFIVITLLLGLTFVDALILFFTLAFGSIILLHQLGDKRRNEIDKIRYLIKSIRKNQSLSMDNIKLDSPLKKLEGNIKAILQKTQGDLENMRKLEKTRSEFLGNVSHELRTPIFSIQGFLETLLGGAIDDEKVNRKFLKKALRNTENLNDLLNDLIDISMIESGQMRMKPEYFNVSELLAPIISEMKEQLENKSLEIKVSVKDPTLLAFGDKDRIKAVIINLFTNAAKYSEEGYIIISAEQKNNSILISVTDSGIGISDDDIKRIFERFYRVDKARSKEVGGSGLGLAIVKHILDAHGSKITVKSILGEGSTFSFKLNMKIDNKYTIQNNSPT